MAAVTESRQLSSKVKLNLWGIIISFPLLFQKPSIICAGHSTASSSCFKRGCKNSFLTRVWNFGNFFPGLLKTEKISPNLFQIVPGRVKIGIHFVSKTVFFLQIILNFSAEQVFFRADQSFKPQIVNYFENLKLTSVKLLLSHHNYCRSICLKYHSRLVFSPLVVLLVKFLKRVDNDYSK